MIKTLYCIFSIILLLSSCKSSQPSSELRGFDPTSLRAFGGGGGIGSSGGGGGFFRDLHTYPILLDLIESNINFKETDQLNAKNRLKKHWDNNFQRYYMIPSEQESFKLLEQRFNFWINQTTLKEESRAFLKLIKELLSKMHFYVIPNIKLEAVDVDVGEKLKQAYPNHRLLALAHYDQSYNGTVVVETYWNMLGSKSQAGLLFHEALRDLQFNLGNKLKGKEIQTLTERFILGTPQSVQSNFVAQISYGLKLEEFAYAHSKRFSIELEKKCQEGIEFLLSIPQEKNLVNDFRQNCRMYQNSNDSQEEIRTLSLISSQWTKLLGSTDRNQYAKALALRAFFHTAYLQKLDASLTFSEAAFRRIYFDISELSEIL